MLKLKMELIIKNVFLNLPNITSTVREEISADLAVSLKIHQN